MSTTLRRIIDLGSGGTMRPGSPGDLRFHDNRIFFAETHTSWVRLWADWPLLQPDPSRSPGDPDGAGAPFLAAIDEQIGVANADGIKVLLQLYRFPAVGQWPREPGRSAQHRRRDLVRLCGSDRAGGVGGLRRGRPRSGARESEPAGTRVRATARGPGTRQRMGGVLRLLS